MSYAILIFGAVSIFLAIILVVASLATAGQRRASVAKGMNVIGQVYSPGGIEEGGPKGTVSQVTSLGKTFASKGATAWLQKQLDRAGNPSDWPAERIMEMQGICLLIGLFLVPFVIVSFGGGVVMIVLGAILGAVVGFWVPFFAIFDAGQRRQQRIQRDLPDAFDLLTLSVEAGLGFDAALSHVSTTMPGPVGREFARVLQEMQMGSGRGEALRALGSRTTVVEFRALATSIVQATELGVPIATVLREQGKEMRIKRRQRAEELANKVSVKILFPLIACLLPALFLVVLGPAVIQLYAQFANR
ncbi:tight adherence protein C [Allocatelliglobosispora scoriae]|uniref:Tight adherence protein C n=1 Tax=Allocatelliglobosispora scoriae TaxID=643052 RepID=A0A841BUW2_9ACTN|nr:type II secretion system F family protein [Allocatelliglobosispora scoriae]MBB5870949.1 tight adherence protein C [Allocatelliglobosispora scoriae]